MAEVSVATNLLGRACNVDTGRGYREGKIAAVYKDGHYLMFLVEFRDGTLDTYLRENITLS